MPIVTGYSKRDDIVRLVMTKDDYDKLVVGMTAGVVTAARMGNPVAAAALLDALERIAEGDPEFGKLWPKDVVAAFRLKAANESCSCGLNAEELLARFQMAGKPH